MAKKKASDDPEPHIDAVYPATVESDTTPVLTLTGSHFNEQSVILADGRVLLTTYYDPTRIAGQLIQDVTHTPGAKSIKVHNTDEGTLSNEVFVTVLPKQGVAAKRPR